jgi:hypothetical protein
MEREQPDRGYTLARQLVKALFGILRCRFRTREAAAGGVQDEGDNGTTF